LTACTLPDSGRRFVNSLGVAIAIKKKILGGSRSAQMRNELNENKYLPSNFIYLENL